MWNLEISGKHKRSHLTLCHETKIYRQLATRPKSCRKRPKSCHKRPKSRHKGSTFDILHPDHAIDKKLQASFGRFKHLFCRKHNCSLSVALVVLFCNSVPLTRPSHLTSLLVRDMNLHPFRKEMSSFSLHLDFLIPSNAYSTYRTHFTQ
jgi:hypothetical protein